MYRQVLEKQRYNALEKWTDALEGIHSAVIGKNPGGAARGGPGESMMSTMPSDFYNAGPWGDRF